MRPTPVDAVDPGVPGPSGGRRPAPDPRPPRPSGDRARATQLMDGLVAAAASTRAAPRPSVESLLDDTPLAGLLPALTRRAVDADLETVRRVLRRRRRVAPGSTRPGARSATVVLSYLDLRARFLLVPAGAPTVTAGVRGSVEAIFRRRPGHQPGGHRGGRQPRPGDPAALGRRRGRHDHHAARRAPHALGGRRLPLTLAARRLLEQSAPEWPSFDFDRAFASRSTWPGSPPRSPAGSSRGSPPARTGATSGAPTGPCVGHEHLFADLVARVSAQGPAVDLDEEITKITRAAA